MRKQASQAVLIATLALCASGGCSQIQTVFHKPGNCAPAQSTQVSSRSQTVVREEPRSLREQTNRTGQVRVTKVASYQPAEVRTGSVRTESKPATAQQSTKNNPASSESKVPAKNIDTNGAQRTRPDNQVDTKTADATKRPYTRPSAGIRSAGLMAGPVAAFALGSTENRSGADLSQSLITGAQGIQGAAGLTAPSPSVGGVTVGNTGIQAGLQTGLASANPNRNLFTPQVNRASGPNGALCDLARAGLLGNNRSCQNLRHRR